MKLTRSACLLMVGVIIGAAITAGTVAVEVGASGTSTTAPAWHGCLSTAGALSKVGTAVPACSGTKKPISWNSYPANANGTPQCTGIPHSGIDLSGCSLEGVQLPDAYLYNSNFAGAYLLVGNFKDANLVDVNFAGANLGESVLAGADGSGANFNNTNLAQADLYQATQLTPSQFVGATWSNTTCPDGTNSGSYSPQTCIGHGI